mgnify:CR=1 FL=1
MGIDNPIVAAVVEKDTGIRVGKTVAKRIKKMVSVNSHLDFDRRAQSQESNKHYCMIGCQKD